MPFRKATCKISYHKQIIKHRQENVSTYGRNKYP